MKSKCSVAVSLVALIINKEILHCLKNDTDVAQYNFNVHQPILVIFGTDVAERAVSYTHLTLPTNREV